MEAFLYRAGERAHSKRTEKSWVLDPVQVRLVGADYEPDQEKHSDLFSALEGIVFRSRAMPLELVPE